MKKLLLVFSFLFSLSSSAQVLCIQCYNQNARVLTDTNNLILNGGFENTTCDPLLSSTFCPNSIKYDCDIANWKCTGGGINTYAIVVDQFSTIVPEGIFAVYFGNYYCNACSSVPDDSSCLIKIGCEVTGIPVGYPVSAYPGYGGTTGVSLEQTINGLTQGAIYKLEFWAGGEDSFLSSGIFAIDVGFGNIFLSDPITEPSVGIGTRYVIAFTATASSHTIKFTNWGHVCSNLTYDRTELILDDVRLFKSSEGNPCGIGINELTKNAVTVFPNPATNLLTITTNTKEPSEIILYDVASRKVMEEKFSGSVSLNVEHLAKGIYLYEVRDGKGGVEKGKIVKE